MVTLFVDEHIKSLYECSGLDALFEGGGYLDVRGDGYLIPGLAELPRRSIHIVDLGEN
jgi:hypothetical protein